jgi:hypothetical protein
MKLQKGTGHRDEATAEQVTEEAPFDSSTETPHADAGHAQQVRVAREDVNELVDLAERSRQVGVPEAHQVARWVVEYSGPDRTRLPMIPVQTKNRDSCVLPTQTVQNSSGLVRAGIVDEKQVSGRTRTNPFKEGFRIETLLFVVTRNDEGERRVAHGT